MVTTTLDSICAHGLPGAPRLAPIEPLEWDLLLERARANRVVAIVANAVGDGELHLTNSDHRELVAAHEASMHACLRLERATVEVADLLDDLGIEYRLLKGPALAHLDYPDPSWRQFGDVDVLVRGAQYDATVRALEAGGAHRRSAEIRSGFDRRFGKGVCMVRRDSVQIDVHRTLAPGPFGHTIGLDSLFLGSESLRIGGREIATLTRECRFLHACIHAVLGDERPRVGVLRDVAQLLLTTDLDLERVMILASGWRLMSVVASAITTTWARLGLESTPLSTWAEGYRGNRFERRALAVYSGPNRSYARQMVAGIPAIPGVSAKFAYIRALLVVSGDYAQRHDGGRGRRTVRALRAMDFRGRPR